MPKLASLPDLGVAPELTNDTWLNVDAPLRLADLHGKVVIADGYHRMCAIYLFDEDAPIFCKIV